MDVLYSVHQRVATITLNRPEKMNAFLPSMLEDFFQKISQAANDEEVRSIVLTGSGKAFCTGIDMSMGPSLLQPDAVVPGTPSLDGLLEAQWADDVGSPLNPVFSNGWGLLMKTRKPLIVAINGPAYGWGAILALHGDIRFMSNSAVLNFTFAKLGVPAEKASAWLLTHHVGPSRALDWLFTARNIGSDECHSVGLVQSVCDDSELLSKAQSYAQRLTTLAPRSLAGIKSQVWASHSQTYEQAYLSADAEQARCMKTKDFAEALYSFVERRPPQFSGR